MNTKLTQRLEALEARNTGHGWRVVYTCDDTPDVYAEFPKGGDYRVLLPDPAGRWHESATLHDRASLDRLKANGWSVIIVRYTDKWRAIDIDADHKGR